MRAGLRSSPQGILHRVCFQLIFLCQLGETSPGEGWSPNMGNHWSNRYLDFIRYWTHMCSLHWAAITVTKPDSSQEESRFPQSCLGVPRGRPLGNKARLSQVKLPPEENKHLAHFLSSCVSYSCSGMYQGFQQCSAPDGCSNSSSASHTGAGQVGNLITRRNHLLSRGKDPNPRFFWISEESWISLESWLKAGVAIQPACILVYPYF